jgi:hypothetical protein
MSSVPSLTGASAQLDTALVKTFRRNMEPSMTAGKYRGWSSHFRDTYAQEKCINPCVHCVIFRDAVHEDLR